MIVYRLTKARYKDELTGYGAQLFGGRWNSKGLPVIYTCESRALCLAEIAVHTPLGILPDGYFLQTIQLPNLKHHTLSSKILAPGWDGFPHTSISKSIGDKFLVQAKYLVMKAPSAIVQDEFNFLLNPLHPEFKKIKLKKVEEFRFDSRLFKPTSSS